MALEGVQVLDLATLFAGPLAATFLGDFAADVIKIEHPRGDPIRGHGHAKDGVPLWWKLVGRNKRALTPNLFQPDGQEILCRLAECAQHADELDRLVGDWIAQHDQGEVISALEAAEAAVAPIYDVSDVMRDPQSAALESIISVPDEELGPVKMQNVLFRMSSTPGRVRWAGRKLGQDTDGILDELGVSADRVANLRARGIV